MTYDHWKTTEPEPNEPWDVCDCCRRPYLMRKLWDYGDKLLCDECVPNEEPGEPKPANMDPGNRQ